MNITAAALVWLVSGFVLANWPFVSEKKFLIFAYVAFYYPIAT